MTWFCGGLQRLRQEVNNFSGLQSENSQLKEEMERLRRENAELSRIRAILAAQDVSIKVQQNVGLSRLKPPLAPQRNLASSTAMPSTIAAPMQQALSIPADEALQVCYPQSKRVCGSASCVPPSLLGTLGSVLANLEGWGWDRWRKVVGAVGR
jgi:FtsZ-binding cell division protein ZapB